MNIEVTKTAIARIDELIQNNNKMVALRVSVDGGGCSGFMYHYTLVKQVNDNDYIFEDNNTKVIIDPTSQTFLDGCTVNFVKELGNSYFQVLNKNATDKCGCGSSFAI